MKVKPQLIIGGVLLVLGGLLTTFTTYYTAQNVVDEISSFSTDVIPWLIANFTYTLIVLTALIGGLLALLRQRTFALILGGAAVLFWIISALAWLLAQNSVDGYVDFLQTLKNVTIGWEGEKFTITLGGLPSFIILIIGVVLIFIGKSSDAVPNFGGFSGAQIVQVDSSAPVTGGMKSCPECAEMIQANAIKCRFCDFRYE